MSAAPLVCLKLVSPGFRGAGPQGRFAGLLIGADGAQWPILFDGLSCVRTFIEEMTPGLVLLDCLPDEREQLEAAIRSHPLLS